jgi:PRTRC genetic system protein B
MPKDELPSRLPSRGSASAFETAIHFSDVPRRYTLKQAILIYKDEQSDCAASIHEVRHAADTQPGLQPGQPVTMAALEALLTALGRRVGGGFIAPEILSVGLDSLVWWCPACRRRIWFKPDAMFDKSPPADVKRLLKISGQFIWYPPLLFKARPDELHVFALATNERPKAKTRLYKAPFWNLRDGGMCNGNLKLPTVTAENIGRFETAFFDSAFTHNSQGGLLALHSKGYCGFLEELASRKTKPDAAYWVKHLIRTQQQVQTQIK